MLTHAARAAAEQLNNKFQPLRGRARRARRALVRAIVMPNLGLIDNINVIHPNFVALSVKRPANGDALFGTNDQLGDLKMTIVHFRPLTHIRRVIRSVAYLLPLQHAELEQLSPCTKYKLAGRSRST